LQQDELIVRTVKQATLQCDLVDVPARWITWWSRSLWFSHRWFYTGQGSRTTAVFICSQNIRSICLCILGLPGRYIWYFSRHPARCRRSDMPIGRVTLQYKPNFKQVANLIW